MTSLLTSFKLLFVMSLMTSSRPTLGTPTPRTRWMHPCGPSSPASGGRSSSDSTVVVGGRGTAGGMGTSFNLPESFRVLSEKTMRLKRRVRELKTLYVQQRFRDETIAEDLEDMGLRLEGMPHVQDATITTLTQVNIVEIAHHAFYHLARVAVFLDQARLGERLAINEPISFERHFERIENHQQEGLYWLMCSVHQIRYHVGVHETDAQHAQDIRSMRVSEVDRNAMRHTRDFIVLRDFEKLLVRLSIEFAAAREASALTAVSS